jgi:hypothetical protein
MNDELPKAVLQPRYPPQTDQILDLLEEYYWWVSFIDDLQAKFDISTVAVIYARLTRTRRVLLEHGRSIADLHERINRLKRETPLRTTLEELEEIDEE